MLNKLKKPNNKGFTIIEVMIVLAIAGLILLIVFLAVPALQRSSRNTAAKSDAGHISSSINDFLSNNNGTLPGIPAGANPPVPVAGNWTTDCATLYADSGTLSQYTKTNVPCGGLGKGAANYFEEFGGAIANTTAATDLALVLDTGAVCPTTNDSSQVTTTPGTYRQACLLYTIQTGSGWVWDSIQSE
jgi:prepilin-type N-terminal cleavage/methylation domain-containing protein